MAHQTTVQWQRGIGGGSGTYVFSPNPSSITRPEPVQRKTELFIPTVDGSVIQTFGLASRKVHIQGVLFVRTPNFDNLMTLKNNLQAGIGTGEGELHIISSSRHIYYKGILDNEIQWGEQTKLSWIDYRFEIACADPTEYVV